MIYIDPLLDFGWKLRGYPQKNCHMISDTSILELIDFAVSIGLKEKWIQYPKNKISPVHFDLTKKRRAEAIRKGAKELSRKEFVTLIRELRKEGGIPDRDYIGEWMNR